MMGTPQAVRKGLKVLSGIAGSGPQGEPNGGCRRRNGRSVSETRSSGGLG